MANKPNRIIWHHSAVLSTKDQFDGINNFHKKRHFPKSSLGFFVGYHYFIEHSGVLRQARLDDEIGAHDKDENVNSIGICLAGNFSVKLPSKIQARIAHRLIRRLMYRWNIPPERIEPHRKNDTTECPGKLLPDDWLTPHSLSGSLNKIIKLLHDIVRSLPKG